MNNRIGISRSEKAGVEMQKVSRYFESLINAIMAICLSIMVILVFGNVVLRYVFNSGINSAEEMSRFLFVWLTFLGSIVALIHNEHLGVDTLVKHLPTIWKKIVLLISNLLMLLCCVLIFQGSWKLTNINLHTKAPATGLPMSIMYVTGIILSAAGALILLRTLFRLLTNKMTDDELVMVKESEELADIQEDAPGKEGKQV
jgi:TRAP-type C4-dicarboxylate transport system permease small subunit